MKKFIKPFSRIFLILLVFVFTNCIQDDGQNFQQIQLDTKTINGAIVDASKYPHILNYLSQKTNGTFMYNIGDSNISPRTNNSFRTQAFGIVDASKTIRISDEEKEKYSFKMEDPNNQEQFVNLIVIDRGDYLEDYFIKYIPNQEWLEQQGRIPNMSTFTGTLEIYNFSGDLTSEIILTDGSTTGNTTNPFPCPEDTQENDPDDTEEDESGDGSSGGAGDANWDDDTTDEGDYGGNTHGGSGSGGGGGCIVQVVFVQCSSTGPNSNSEYPHSAESCGANPPTGSYYTISMIGGGCRTASPSGNNTTDENEPDPCNPGDVGVIIDEVIDFEEEDWVDYTCQKKLVSQANTTTGAISDIFQGIFNSDLDEHIIYKTANLGGPFVAAHTDPAYYPYITTFNTWRLENSTDLDIIKTTIHEMIHASLLYFWDNPGNGFGNSTNTDPSFIELVDTYNLFREENDSGGDTQHEYMTQLIEQIGDAIETWADANGYADLDSSYFDKLAWGGLRDLQNSESSFNLLYPDDPINGNQEREAIENAIHAEMRLTGSDAVNAEGIQASTINCD